jgi:hypothetical protein
MGGHAPAAICRRGHVLTSDAMSDRARLAPRCEKCGAEVLTRCPACERQIRGVYIDEEGYTSLLVYEVPDFCAYCGMPFPWASRQARIYQLMDLLEAEGLDPATELKVREQLEALTNPDIEEGDERKRWERVKQLAPKLWEKTGAQQILVTVVSAGLKQQLGLP